MPFHIFQLASDESGNKKSHKMLNKSGGIPINRPKEIMLTFSNTKSTHIIIHNLI